MLTEKTFRPGGVKHCQLGICTANVGDVLYVIPDFDRDGGHVIVDESNEAVGILSPSHWVSIDLGMGRQVLHASVNSTGTNLDGLDTVTVRIVTGDDYDIFAMPAAASVGSYSVNVVGESYRQDAIARTRAGERVILAHDDQNTFDPRAIAVLNSAKEQIGFLPRDGWLTGALLDERKKFRATVLEIHQKSPGRPHAAVVLQVVLV